MNILTINKIFSLSRPKKRFIQITSDMAIIVFCFWMAMALRLDGIFTYIKPTTWMVLAAVIPTTILAFARLGLYRAVVRYMAERTITVIVIGAGISSTVMFVSSQYFLLEVPRSVSVIYFSLLVLITGGTRLAMRSVYLAARDVERTPVVIYGAGEAGHLLTRSLQDSKNYRPYLLIDDDPRLHGTTLRGIPILPLETAKKRIYDHGVNMALIAIGEADEQVKRQAALSMAELGLEVRMIPKMSDIISGRVKVSSLPSIKIEELLGRSPVAADPKLLGATITGRSVMVTGAGGSIGSELCRQIFHQRPRRIVLIDTSEFALYSVLSELELMNAETTQSEVELVPILGSVTRQHLMDMAVTANQVDSIYHAAAYKHVPLVEKNAIEAVRNNVLGTQVAAHTAGRLGVKHFALISTDKAVRPTNIMGATKRLAELTMQKASNEYPQTKFCAVRFGNVLASSGSVIPKFEKQIQSGGPITVTHEDITRYFMTIPEAANLVIQASAMSKTGNTYILDMGKPVKILDLAKKMCALHGKKFYIIGKDLPINNAIGIKITALRPGEKMFEELTISDNVTATQHPRISVEAPFSMNTESIDKILEQILKSENTTQLVENLKKSNIGYLE